MIGKTNTKNDDKKCSFEKMCWILGPGCDRKQEEDCEFAKEIGSVIDKPCQIMQNLKDVGNYISDVSCDIQNIRACAPGGKCIYKGKCVREFIPEVRKMLEIRGKEDVFTKQERLIVRGSVNTFFAKVRA